MFWRLYFKMKRRVLSKTTPFHAYKKKKRPNGVVLNDTVHLSSSPEHYSGEEGKVCITYFSAGPSTNQGPTPVGHRQKTLADHPPRCRSRGRPAWTAAP